MSPESLSYASSSTPVGDRRRRWSRTALAAFGLASATPLFEGLLIGWAVASGDARRFLTRAGTDAWTILVLVVVPVVGAAMGVAALEHLSARRPRLRGWAPALAAVVLQTVWSLAGLLVAMWANGRS